MGYSIGQAAQKTGLTTHTLRYYEKEGLLPFVRKNSAGLRVFSDNDINWLNIIECLKATGMPLKGIKQYIDWFREGDATLPQRLEMFKQQEKNIKEHLHRLQTNLSKISYKIRLYDKAVELGSLERAQELEEFKNDRLKLFGH